MDKILQKIFRDKLTYSFKEKEEEQFWEKFNSQFNQSRQRRKIQYWIPAVAASVLLFVGMTVLHRSTNHFDEKSLSANREFLENLELYENIDLTTLTEEEWGILEGKEI